jgi:hypothetical protein
MLHSHRHDNLKSYIRITLHASVASYGYAPTSPILVTLIMEALSSSETSADIKATRRNVPEDAILHGTFP